MKKKKVMQTLALLLTMVLFFNGCGKSKDNNNSDTSGNTSDDSNSSGDNSDDSDDSDSSEETDGEVIAEPIKDLTIALTVSNELDTMIMQHSEGGNVSAIGGNSLSPLIEFDSHGTLIPAVATEWGTDDDGLTWTFKLRDDVTYVDVDGKYLGDCTAQDWITSLEWILNFYKNGGLNTSMTTSTIAGAREYYDYTKNLAEAEALALDTTVFLEMVGIEAPDDHTLIYHCVDKLAYFDTLATGSCLYPMPQGMIDAVGVGGVVGISNEDFWYSGPYRLTTWVLNNEKVLTKNESYWDKDCTLFESVTMLMVEDGLVDDQLWETDEVDFTTLDVSTLSTILADKNNEWYDNLTETRVAKYSSSLLFNYYKLKEDGTPDENWNTAIGNEAFRLSMYWGLDLTNYWYLVNSVNPMNLENLAYTAESLGVFSDGTDYTDRVIELLEIPEGDGTTPRRYNATMAEEYKQQAMEELTAEGVTFPIEIDYFIKAGTQKSLDQATILKEIFDALGTDYITFNIKTFVSSETDEVRNPQLATFFVVGWGADFGDVSNFIDQCLYGDDAAIYSVERFNLADVTNENVISQFQEYTKLAREAATYTGNKDERLEAYAKAEAYLVSKALVIPFNNSVNWQLTKVNDYSKMYAAYGLNDAIYKNWETSTVPYTTEDYEQFKAEYEAGSNK